jgi:hypothetical protein
MQNIYFFKFFAASTIIKYCVYHGLCIMTHGTNWYRYLSIWSVTMVGGVVNF